MVTWDDSWTFYIRFETHPHARIVSASIAEADGRTVSVWNGETVSISNPPISIAVTVENDRNGSGTIYVECFVDGKSIGRRQVYLTPGGRSKAGSLVWHNVQIPSGKHTVTIKAGH